MPTIECLQSELSYLQSVLPTYFVVGLVSMYLLIGALLWSRFMFKWAAEDGLDDHLVLAERLGTHTLGETVALMVVKFFFYMLWPLFIALMYGCKLIGLLRFGRLHPAT